jgi:hypothetical protein
MKSQQKVKIDEHEKDEENGHMIRITKKLVIDTKKMKKYMKQGFKFAFSQIGLAGLVVGYVILGALLFMKIESAYEKENQSKIEKNRDDFFENVKISAEHMFNEYLKENFHMKYSKYRNEEILLREKELVQNSIYAQQNLSYHMSQRQQDPVEDTFDKESSVNYFFNYNNNNNVQRSHRNRDTEIINKEEHGPGEQAMLEQHGNTEVSQVDNSNVVKLDKKANEARPKPTWYVELDKETFYREIKNHLRNLLIENDKIEDKEKQAALVREDVWTYPNALLYSTTVITTIGIFLQE